MDGLIGSDNAPVQPDLPPPAVDEAGLAPAEAAPAESPQPPSPPPVDRIQPLNELSAQGKWQELEHAGRALLAEARAGEALEVMAYGLQQQGRLADAARLASVAAGITPERWFAQFIAGVAYQGLGQLEPACRHLRRALEILPADRQTIRQFLEAVSAAEGLERAGAEYAAHCERSGQLCDVAVAPIRSVRDWAREQGVALRPAGEMERIPFKAPRAWDAPVDAATGSAWSNLPYLADLRDVRIFGNSSIVLTADGTALSDTGGDPRFGSIVSFAYERVVLAQGAGKLLLDPSPYETRELGAGILLSGLASSAFGHWLPEFLPKLQFLQQHPDYAALPLVVDAGMPKAHFDHLRRFCGNPLVLLQPNESLRCQRLLVAPAPTFLPVDTFPNDRPMSEMPGLSPRALRFLRGDAAPPGTGPGTRKVFLGRRNMQWRRLANEQEIEAALVALGFETAYLEELEVDAQIELFRTAGWIVAPNGSSLLNLIFADPGVKLLVLSQAEMFNWGTFQGPMESLGYQPLWVCGDVPTGVNSKHVDYAVPVERVLAALRALGLPEAP